MSFVKTLLTKKVYDQQRLANAIRNSAAGATPVANGGGSSSTEDEGHESADDGGRREGINGAGSRGGGTGEIPGGTTGGPVEERVVERTELEVATEAAVVRARDVGEEARRELRQSMNRWVRLEDIWNSTGNGGRRGGVGKGGKVTFMSNICGSTALFLSLPYSYG